MPIKRYKAEQIVVVLYVRKLACQRTIVISEDKLKCLINALAREVKF
jgi:hypothetical protein